MSAMVHVVGNVEVRYRGTDNYVNATALCKQFDAKWEAFHRNERTRRFIEALAANTRILASNLVEARRGNGGGTFVHPDLAIELAAWLSPEFGVQMAQWVRRLLTAGRVELPAAPPPAPSGFVEVPADDAADPLLAQILALAQTRQRQLALERQQAALARRQDETRRVAEAALARVEEVRGAQADTHALALCAANTSRAALDHVETFHGYVSIRGFFRLHGWECPEAVAAVWGRRLSAACRRRGLRLGQLRDERHGVINSYPESLLREFFADRLAADQEAA